MIYEHINKQTKEITQKKEKKHGGHDLGKVHTLHGQNEG